MDTSPLQEMLSYKSLETNWDGEGAVRPSQKSIDYAVRFYDALPLELQVDAMPTVDESGIAGWYWKRPNTMAIVTVSETGRAGYLVRRNGIEDVADNDVYLGRDPKPFLDAMATPPQ